MVPELMCRKNGTRTHQECKGIEKVAKNGVSISMLSSCTASAEREGSTAEEEAGGTAESREVGCGRSSQESPKGMYADESPQDHTCSRTCMFFLI